MTQINNDDEAKLAYPDWCKWNARELSKRSFVSMYGILPHKFKNIYWAKGLQNTWIKFAVKRRKND